MSWLYSQVLVEEYLAANSLDGEQSVQLSGKPTPLAYCAPDKMTEFSRLSRFGMTYKPLMADRGEELLTLYLAGFHVKTSVPQEKAQELMENDQECGEKWHGSFVKYDPNTSSWKTHQCSLLGDLDEFSETWPQWGLMRNGECWEQQMLEQYIRGTESGLSEQTFPTPVASDSKGGKSNTVHYKNQRFVRISNTTSTEFGAKLSAAYQLMTGNPLPPSFSEWMMGWQIGWTDLKPLEMDKCLYARLPLGEYSQKDN